MEPALPSSGEIHLDAANRSFRVTY